MTQGDIIYRYCRVCRGKGTVSWADPETGEVKQIECYHCKGVKKFKWGEVKKD